MSNDRFELTIMKLNWLAKRDEKSAQNYNRHTRRKVEGNWRERRKGVKVRKWWMMERKLDWRRDEVAKLEKATFPARRVLSRIVTPPTPVGIWPMVGCILELMSYCLWLALLFMAWCSDTPIGNYAPQRVPPVVLSKWLMYQISTQEDASNHLFTVMILEMAVQFYAFIKEIITF